MGTSSELSEALNFSYATPQRARQQLPAPPDNNYQQGIQQQQQQQQQYIPHRSELEHAISPTQAPLPPARTQHSQGAHSLQTLVKLVATTHQAAEIERKRRLAWEQEQEARYAQRQAEVERQLLSMRHEISALRTLLTPSYTPYGGSPSVAVAALPHQMSLMAHPSPALGPSPLVHSAVPNVNANAYGHNASPLLYQAHNTNAIAIASSSSHPPPSEMQYTPSSLTPSPSPHLQPAITEPPPQNTTTPTRPKKQKRKTTSFTSDASDSDSEAQSSDSESRRRPPRKRRNNHHDQECFTIHNAMRRQMLKLMDTPSSNNLPESYTEGLELGESDPIRFVWDKTSKQSVHNARMKARVVANLKENRHQFSKVPDTDFSNKNLDLAFDQCFTTFRQKFKTQKDTNQAIHNREREDRKAKRSRHTLRRKNKLTQRADARLRIAAFEHVTFDGAFQHECMSSDESGGEDERDVVYAQGYSWRSRRLMSLFDTLDKQAVADGEDQPTRGKKTRLIGRLKDGVHLPPKGISSWMVSRRWLSELQSTNPELVQQVYASIEDHPDTLTVVGGCNLLGHDSDAEG